MKISYIIFLMVFLSSATLHAESDTVRYLKINLDAEGHNLSELTSNKERQVYLLNSRYTLSNTYKSGLGDSADLMFTFYIFPRKSGHLLLFILILLISACKKSETLNAPANIKGMQSVAEATVYHEVLHAYMTANFSKTVDGLYNPGNGHDAMANNYVTLMTGSLRSAFPTLSERDAWALSWGGLEKTTLYNQILTAEEQNQIENTNRKYGSKNETDKQGTYCN